MKKEHNGLILIVLFLGVLMGAMDISIVGPALPSIIKEFSITERDLSWIFNIYILFNLISVPLMSKLSDNYGRKWIYVIDVILFGLGSILVAVAPNFEILLLARAIQGFGAGGIFPVASAVIGDIFPPEKRGGALGLIGAVFGLAFIIGPILGGILLPMGWRILFYMNIPLVIFVIILAIIFLPKKVNCIDCKFDFLGAFVLTITLALFAYGISRIDTTNFIGSFFSFTTGGFIVLSLLLLPLFVFIEKRKSYPIINLELFKSKQIIIASIINVVAGLIESSLIFLPMYAVTAFMMNVSKASFMMLPLVIAMSIGSPIIGRLLDVLGSKKVLITGSILLALGLLLLGVFSYLNIWIYFIAISLTGLGLSAMLGSPIRYIFLAETPEEKRSMAQGLVNLGSSIGMLLGGATIGALIGSVHGTAGYQIVFVTLGFAAVLAFCLCFFLKKKNEEYSKASVE